MLGTPAWHIDPFSENGGMTKPTEASPGSSLVNNIKSSGFYSDMQYPATHWHNVGTASKTTTSFACTFQGATPPEEQMHHVSPTPVTTATEAQLNLDFMDDLLTYNQMIPEIGTPYANIFRHVDNASPQTASGMTARKSVPVVSRGDAPAHPNMQDCCDISFDYLQSSPMTTCTGLLNTLSLLSGSSGGADQGLGGSSMSMEQWDATTAFRSANSPASGTQGSPVYQSFDPSIQGLGQQLASADLHQVLATSAMPQSRLLPVTSGESTQLIASLPPLASSWGQPMLEMSNPCLTQMDLPNFLSSEGHVNEVFNQRGAYFGAQHMQLTSHQHTLSMTGLIGETRQDPVAAQACLNSSDFIYSGHAGEVSISRNVNTVHLVDNLPGRLDMKRRKSQFDHISEASTVATPAGVEGTLLQPHRVPPFPSGSFTMDGTPVWLAHSEQQDNAVHSIPGTLLTASGKSFRNVALPIDPISHQATGLAYRPVGSSKSSANVLFRQRKLQRLAPLVKARGDQFEEVQMSQPAAGSPNFLRRTSSLHWSPKDALKAEDHVVRERRRRDVMNTRFQTLESLLPKPICRRDRYGIVEDAMVYVKEMERVLAHLNAKAASTKQRLERQVALRQQQQHIQEQPPSTSECPMTVSTSGLLADLGQANSVPRATWSGNMIQDSGTMSKDCKVEVIMPSSHQDVAIVVEYRSGCGGRLFSGVLRVIETLNLEVVQFSVTKCEEFFLCNAACKSQGSMGMSNEQFLQQFVTLLQAYFTVKCQRSCLLMK